MGWGVDEKYNTEKNKKSGWLLDIGVLKTYRGKGIGAALMLHGMKTLRSQGMEEALLYVDDMNITKALELYEKVGFTAAKKEIVYLKEL